MAPWNWCNVSWLGQLINSCCNFSKVGFKNFFLLFFFHMHHPKQVYFALYADEFRYRLVLSRECFLNG